MKKFYSFLLAIIFVLMTCSCALPNQNDALDTEDTTAKLNDDTPQDTGVYNPSEFSFGEGVPVFNETTLADYFTRLNEKVKESEQIEINTHEYVKTLAKEIELAYEEKDGKMLFAATPNDARLIYTMFFSAILNQYPDNYVTYDYDYNDSYNREPRDLLFLTFDHTVFGYATPLDYLKGLYAKEIDIVNNSYNISYYDVYLATTAKTSIDHAERAFNALGITNYK